MAIPLTRRGFLKAAAGAIPTVAAHGAAAPADAAPTAGAAGWVAGKLTGAQAIVEALRAENVGCVFGIPGAQENELWDEMKQRGLGYVLVTHEFAASTMADGYARATGQVGVACVIPGPGLTNALSGVGEALLDSVPMVIIVGDVARGERFRAFQVHDLPQAELLRPVTKSVISVSAATDIPGSIRSAFALARQGEPGPVGVVIPYDLMLETAQMAAGPVDTVEVCDLDAAERALALLANPHFRVGLYVGQGCFGATSELAALAEMLQAPVATSVSGKGAISDHHPLSVGWGYGPQGTKTAEMAFKRVDLVLAIGVKYTEVSTAFYSIPKTKHLIHVDINPENLGRNVKADVCVACDAGTFMRMALARKGELARPSCPGLRDRIARWRKQDAARHAKRCAKHGVDPAALLLALREKLCADALLFVDVSLAEHWAAEMFEVYRERTYFNPTDNQSMGWSIPASIGAKAARPDRTVVALTGDGCFFMAGMELANAARAGLAVKVFLLDNGVYEYMRTIQEPAFGRTTATVLPRLDYAAFAAAMGVAYYETAANENIGRVIDATISEERPTLARLTVDYGSRPVRWIEATKDRFIDELSAAQKVRFLARLAGRGLDLKPPRND